MRVFDSEVRRFLSRRLVRIMFLLCVIGFVIAGVVVFFKSSNVAPEAPVLPGELGPNEFPELHQFAVDKRFHLREFRSITEGMNGLFIPLFMLLGASFIGAEWATRNVTSSLTFEPRRLLLLTSKLGAAIAVAFVATFVLTAVLFLCLLPSALFRGTTTGVDASWFVGLLKDTTRAGLLAAFGATFGFSIATIGRNAAAALGVGFVYFAILENVLRQWRPNLQRWLLGDNIGIFVIGHGDEFIAPGRTALEAGLTLLLYGALIYGAAALFFRSRDIA